MKCMFCDLSTSHHTLWNSNICGAVPMPTAVLLIEKQMVFIFLFVISTFVFASTLCLCIGISCLSVDFEIYNIMEKDH